MSVSLWWWGTPEERMLAEGYPLSAVQTLAMVQAPPSSRYSSSAPPPNDSNTPTSAPPARDTLQSPPPAFDQ